MKTLIVIPARYGSTRFPGKPLAKIAGKEMLLRVWENAQKAASKFEGCQAVVATDDERIMDFCRSRGIDAVMTSVNCPTGTDRVIEAAEQNDVPVIEFTETIPDGSTYVDWMNGNADALAEALG